MCSSSKNPGQAKDCCQQTKRDRDQERDTQMRWTFDIALLVDSLSWSVSATGYYTTLQELATNRVGSLPAGDEWTHAFNSIRAPLCKPAQGIRRKRAKITRRQPDGVNQSTGKIFQNDNERCFNSRCRSCTRYKVTRACETSHGSGISRKIAWQLAVFEMRIRQFQHIPICRRIVDKMCLTGMAVRRQNSLKKMLKSHTHPIFRTI